MGKAFLSAGPWRMKAAFGAFLAQADESGELRVEDPEPAAEQFVSMCNGLGDLERRFGVEVSEDDHNRRIVGAVDVFLRVYSR